MARLLQTTDAGARTRRYEAQATGPSGEQGKAVDAAATQRIVKIRRDYNTWVANETMEDYSLRFTPRSFRKWSEFKVANTALGAVSFLALEAIGGFRDAFLPQVQAARGHPGAAAAAARILAYTTGSTLLDPADIDVDQVVV